MEQAIVMRAALRSRFPNLFPGVTWEYFIIENPFGPVRFISNPDEEELTRELKVDYKARQVSRQDARDYVKEHGLVKVYDTPDGQIYDRPDGKFRKEFHLNTKDKIKKIEAIWDR